MPSGNVVKVYRERVDVDEIVRDAAVIDVSPAERRLEPLPFQGTFYSALPLRNYLPYGRELLDSGLERAAVMAFERAAQANPGALDALSSGHAARQERGDGARPARRSSARSPCNRIWPKPTTISAHCSRRGAISTPRSAGFVRRWHRRRTIPTR